MRRWVLIGGTLAVLAVVFTVFLWSQRGIRLASTARPLTPADRPSVAATQIGSIGGAESAGVYTFDKKTGLRQSRFGGRRFTPKEGDLVLVEKPQIEFYIGKRRAETVRIEGETGLIVMPGGGPRIRADLSSTPVQTPSRGSMQNVTVTYYLSDEGTTAKTPELTVKMPNAFFDADLYEIATESYVDTEGKKIAAEDVPIVLRGETFDFDGKGLTIRWDERSEKLKSMVVYHGDRLVLKKPLRQFGRPGEGAATRLPLAGVQLAAAEATPALHAAVAEASNNKGIYRATFNDKVVVTQNEKTLATGAVMHVDFMEPESEPPQATRPGTATRPAVGTAAPAGATGTAKPAGGSTGDRLGIDRNQPIVVRWAGQLVVKPAPEESLSPQSSRDAVLRLAGSESEPVRLQSEGGWIEGAWAAYQVEREFAWVEGATGKPVRMADSKGSVLTTPQLRYSRQEGKAVLRGPSTAELVQVRNAEEQVLRASWRDLAEATFVGRGGEDDISKLVLQGDVKVTHPRLQRFNAGSLALDFVPNSAQKSGQGKIRQITASDGVDCIVADADRPTQAIRANRLKMLMSQDDKGDEFPSRVEASGSVFAGDATEQIQADAIQADLVAHQAAKSTAGKDKGYNLAGLEHLVASGNVRVRTAKGETITGDRLQVRQTIGRESWVVLEGKPATVVQEGSTLSATFLEIDTATGKAIATGGGKLAASDAKLSKTSKGMPIEVTWTGDGNVDGSKNLAVVQGNVIMKYTDPDGSINEASGDRVEIGLAPKPGANTQQKKQFSFLSDRVVERVTLLPVAGGDVKVQSLLPGPNGALLRQMNLFGPRLDCVLAKDGVTEIDVPAEAKHPGRLLYIAMPPGTREAVKGQDPLRLAQASGATAFSWTRELTYDRSRGQVTMEGDVQVRHNPMLPGSKKFSMAGQKIVADVIAKGAAGSSVPASPVEGIEMRKITLTGTPVRLERDDTDLTAPLITIDPAASTVRALATSSEFVQVEKGRMTGAFDAVDLNTRTNEMNFSGARGTGRQ